LLDLFISAVHAQCVQDLVERQSFSFCDRILWCLVVFLIAGARKCPTCAEQSNQLVKSESTELVIKFRITTHLKNNKTSNPGLLKTVV